MLYICFFPLQATTAGVEDVMDFFTPMDRVTLDSFLVHDPDLPMRMNDLSDPPEEVLFFALLIERITNDGSRAHRMSSMTTIVVIERH